MLLSIILFLAAVAYLPSIVGAAWREAQVRKLNYRA